MIRKFHRAKVANDPEVVVWGTGPPRREFLYVDDLADACLFLMKNYQEGEIINIGVGQDLQIIELAARRVAAVTGFSGRIVLDPSYPDGTPRKLLDVSKINALGWQPRILLTYFRQL
jgi:GDP-L-fucose synthase